MGNTLSQQTVMDKKRLKQPRKISARYLENAALYYLQRYASSAANLRRIMKRKIDRSCAFHEEDAEAFYPVLDKMIERYIASGLLNDRVYAESRANAFRRRGLSCQAITAKLQAKGLLPEDITAALETIDADKESPELEAAQTLARRKKLGPFRKKTDPDPQRHKKDLAVLARAGFSYDIAKAVLAQSPDDASVPFT